MVFGKMGFSKKVREEVYNKTNGKCAYCGCELPKRWHIDHVVPVERDFTTKKYTGNGTDAIDNLLPACPSCNIFKSCGSLQQFRESIRHTYSTVATSGTTTFLIAERFGVVERYVIDVEFYFEKLGIEIPSLYVDLLKKEEKRLKETLELMDYAKHNKDVYWNEEYYNKELENSQKAIRYYKDKITC